MDCKDVEQLLELYWQAKTSLEQERLLRQYFAEETEIPAHLLRYKPLFDELQHARSIGTSSDFDSRLLARIEHPVVQIRRVTVLGLFKPLIRAAAVVALVLWLGGVAQHSFFADDDITNPDSTYQEVGVGPRVAYEQLPAGVVQPESISIARSQALADSIAASKTVSVTNQ